MTDATLTAAEGVGTAALEQRSLTNVPRSLYVYENVGVEPLSVAARSLYTYENRGIEALTIAARSLYAYENREIQALTPLARGLYLYEAARDGEPFPWLMKIDPAEQVRGGQVDLWGDGLGEVIERAADVSNTITASSTSAGNIPANAVDRNTSEWIGTSGAASWLRIAFPSPRVVVGIGLEDIAAGGWGVPEFRFSDGGANIVGAVAPSARQSTAEYPVGATRIYYALPAPRTTDYVEIRVSSGGSGTNRGLSEVWVYCDEDTAAEGSSVLNNIGLPAEAVFGIVSWSGRSPNLWPANSGVPVLKAATITVPNDAESGMLTVEESI